MMEVSVPVTRRDLRRHRLALGLSIHDVARAVNVAPSRLMDIEDGLAPLLEHEVFARAFAKLRHAKW
jgi:cytoskeletal protein RodZ